MSTVYGLTEDWKLVTEKRYPGYSTYRGPAKVFYTDWYSLGFIFIDADVLIGNIVAAVTSKVQGLILIQSKVWKKAENLWGLPYYHYKLEFYAYVPPETAAISPQYVQLILIIILAVVVGYFAVQVTQNVKDITWGPPGTPNWMTWLLPAAILLVAGGYAYSKFK